MFRRRITIVSASVSLAVGFLIAGAPQPGAAAAGPPGGQSTGKVWESVSTGLGYSCGIRTDHTLWCWGSNWYGELGVGDTVPRTSPTQVGSGTNWARVDLANYHTCGIRTNNTLWCWGWNVQGQLGLGDNINRHNPTRVGTGSTWATITVGGSDFDEAAKGFSCATQTDHSLWCWGNNDDGQLGVGDWSHRSLPTRVGTGRDWSTVAAGGYDSIGGHTCGTRADHTLWCWGGNWSGQLGIGSLENRNTPTQAGTDTDWLGVRVSGEHSCGLRIDHTLWCWGANGSGELGLGDTTQRLSPVRVGSGANWTSIRAGYAHTCGTRTDHTLWCWGDNGEGQLGLGDYSGRLVPTRV